MPLREAWFFVVLPSHLATSLSNRRLIMLPLPLESKHLAVARGLLHPVHQGRCNDREIDHCRYHCVVVVRRAIG